MSAQARLDISNLPFILLGKSLFKDAETIEQDSSRTTVLEKLTVMAKKNILVSTTGTPDGDNVGTGTVTGVVAVPGPSLLVGDYELECTFAVTNGGVFKLTDPNGNIVASNLTMRVGSTFVTTFIVAGLKFSITEATDFEAGDFFVITVSAVNKWVPLDPAAGDGSQIFAGIYMGDEIAAATLVSGDVEDLPILVGGACTVARDLLVFENSATLDTLQSDGKTIEQSMSLYGIIPEYTVDIDSYEN